MDFSSLDLLASTALRDNNQTPSDKNSTSHPQISQDNTVDSEEGEDDETDGDKDDTSSVNLGAVAEDSINSDDSCNMGSVKIGKTKKGTNGTTNKPVLKSIFVCDGKYVAKKVSAAGKVLAEESSKKKNATGHPVVVTDSIRTEEKPEICGNNNAIPDLLQLKLHTVSEIALSQPVPEAPAPCSNIDRVEQRNQVNADQREQAVLGEEAVGDCVSGTSKAVSPVCDFPAETAADALSDNYVTGVSCSSQEGESAEEAEESQVTSDSQSSAVVCDSLAAGKFGLVGAGGCDSPTSAEAVVPCHSQTSQVMTLTEAVVPCHSQTSQVRSDSSDLSVGRSVKDSQNIPSNSESELQIQALQTAELTHLNGHEICKEQPPSASSSSGKETVELHSISSSVVLNGDKESNLSLTDASLLPSSTKTKPSDVRGVESSPSPVDKETVKAAAESDGCDNCDDKCVVPTLLPCTSPSSPASPLLLPPSSFPFPLPPFRSTTNTDAEMDSPRDNLDQDIISSGIDAFGASTSSLHAMLSAPHVSLVGPPPPSADTVLMDHCYFCSSDKLVLGQSVENTDDSVDAFESADENASADDIERRPRSLSVDSEYLQYGVPTASGQNDKTLLSPTLSVDSISNDSSMSEHSSAAGSHFYSILLGGQASLRPVPQQRAAVTEVDALTAGLENSRLNASMLDTSAQGPKCGKFRIGTFGSFSNSHLDLETDAKKLKIGIPPDSVMKPSISSPALVSPGSPFPLLQSPGTEWDRSDAGSEAPDDLDSSTTEDKFLSSSLDSETFTSVSGQVWNHPVFHDHDYCCKEVSEKLGKPLIPPVKSGKRKNARNKKKLEAEEDKLKKGKYLKMELLKQDNRFSLAAGGRGEMDSRTLLARQSLLADSLTSRPNPVGRPRKRLEKQVEEYDAETGTKMKITGKYQDQYVYYYSKTSRNRRRKVDDKISGDKIILPPSKPGDIVVPHLTDDDCEAIRRGGRSAFKGGGGAYNPTPSHLPSPHLPHAESGDIMDSSIVNTILSMESDNLATSPMSSQEGDLDGIAENLTNEQFDLLLDCLKDVEVATTSQALDKLLTSAETTPMVPNYLDSLAGTTVEEDFLVPGLPLTSATHLPTVPALAQLPVKTEPGVTDVSSVPEQTDVPFIKQEVIEDESDIKPVTTNLSGTPSTQPSVEKNLEFLKNPNIKSDFYPASSGSGSSFAPVPNSAALSIEAETPWIVTVTLYWNDIPAIIINNSPYVRLVDIHRQILPAKDTGILKKRCQLMHIHVSNCSEMQRYFLVQYGRAHNSKSTLVITKDEAWRLISYYANPQPRNLRGEEGTTPGRSSSYADLHSYTSDPAGRHPHPTPAPGFAHPRKRGGFRRRHTPTRSRNPSPESVVVAAITPDMEHPPPSPLPAEPASPSKRLRNKKINFLEMLKGEDGVSHASSPVVEGGVADDNSALGDEGLSSKTGRNKRRGSKGLADGSPSKRCRNNRQSLEEKKKVVSEELSQEPEISVDGDCLYQSADSVKNKKRSPGLSSAVSLSAASRSPKSKLGPIKVNVKSLVHSASPHGTQLKKKSLFGRKSVGADTTIEDGTESSPSLSTRHLRVLGISHQDAEAVCPQGPSPAAEVHLDLYKRASSPCVRCNICDQFLTVPGFLKHHHLTDSFQGLVNARRMLVPMNKENISAEEQQLWNEFVELQARLDHSVSAVSMGAYPLSPAASSHSQASPQDTECTESLQGPAEKYGMVASLPHAHHHAGADQAHEGLAGGDSETRSVFSANNSYPLSNARRACDDTPPPDPSTDSPWEPQISVCSPPSLSLPVPGTYTQLEETFIDSASKDANIKVHPTSKKGAPVKKQQVQRVKRDLSPSNVRTSSRQRKRKQFYGFENYDFAAGGKKSARTDGDAQDSLVDVTGTMAEEDSVYGIDSSNGSMSTPMHESECVNV